MKKVTKIARNTVDLTEQSKLRVAAYCRVSTDSEEQLVSLETQIKHYESYISANPDWEFLSCFFRIRYKAVGGTLGNHSGHMTCWMAVVISTCGHSIKFRFILFCHQAINPGCSFGNCIG